MKTEKTFKDLENDFFHALSLAAPLKSSVLELEMPLETMFK